MKSNMSEEVLFRRNVHLAEHCSFEIGGEASCFSQPRTLEELQSLIQLCLRQGRPYYIFGYGSNILFPDAPDRDMVYISLKYMIDTKMPDDQGDQKLFLTSGVPLSFVAIIGMLARYEKLLFTYLLPGSVGAGVYINAKCYDDQMSEIIKKIYYIDTDDITSGIHTISANECEFGYKRSIFQRQPWIVVGIDIGLPEVPEAVLTSVPQMLSQYRQEILQITKMPEFYRHFHKMATDACDQLSLGLPQQFDKIDRDRNSKQHFSYPSCGSVFKNNYGYGVPMGVLIERLNLKGKQHGGAMISPHHGNFIINYDRAKAADVVYLIEYVQEAVNKAYGFVPEPEVVIL